MPQWVVAVWDWMNSPIGSGITATAIIAIIVASWKRLRRQLIVFVERVWAFLVSLRVTTSVRQAAAVKAAVAEASREPDPDPAEVADLERQRSRERDWSLRKWAVVRNQGEKYAYHLENVSAGDAEEVRVKCPLGGFEFMSDASWASIPGGEHRVFHGRIVHGALSSFGVSMSIEWIDAHGDAHTYDTGIE